MKYNDGTDHTIEPVNGVYSFTMPKTDVTISADIEHTLYSINVDESITHGSVSAAVGETQNAKTAYYGDDVTLTVTPNDGYLIDSVTYNDGTDHTITPVDGNYSFTMPESNVTISATFVPDPTHFSQDGDTYTIHDETGWNVFCDCLDDNATYNRFSGKTVKLDADITVSRSAGYNSHDFCGTFDGQGHTLTFNYGTSDNYADVENISPFSYVSNTKANPDDTENSPVTIKDLHVKGDIYTTKKYAAGLISQLWGTVNIENCRSSIVIHSKVSGDGTHGGFVAVCGGTLNFEGCVFDGKLLTTGTTDTGNCAGFAAWGGENVNISDSIYAPAAIDTATGEKEVVTGTGDYPGRTFARKTTGSVSNSYYTRTLGIEQGKQGHTITAGQDVSVALGGTATEYNVSGITAYENNSGLKYGNTIYAGNGESVSLTLGHTTPTGYSTAFTASAGTLENGVLTMPDSNVVISANDTINKYTVTLPEKMEITNGVTLTDGKADYGTEIKFKVKDGYTASNVKANGTDLTADENGVYTVTVTDIITVTADVTKAPVSVTYVDENGTEHTVDAIPLDGTETIINSGWYVVSSDVNYTSQLTIDGDVKLILCDGYTLDVNSSQSVYQKIGEGNALTIYGQSGQSGKFTVTNTNSNGIAFNGYAPVTINGGDLTFTGGNAWGVGLDISNPVTINAGKVKATGVMGICSCDLTVNGGQVEFSSLGGVSNCYNVVLGMNKPTDYIKIGVKNCSINGYLKVADGLTLIDEDGNLYSGTLKEAYTFDGDDILAGKTLVRAYTVTLTESVANGTVTADKPFVAANAENKTVTLTVTPNEHYQVKSVTVNGTAATKVDDTHYSFTMPAGDVTVSAEFELQKHTVSISSENCQIIVRKITDNDSYGVVVHNGDKIEYGTKLIYDVAADYGYYLGSENGTIYTTKTYETTVNGDTAITAVGYAKNYRLSLYTYGGGGSPVIIGEHDYAPYNSYLTIKAGTPNEGYEFVGWYQTNGKFLSSDEEYNVKMTSGMSIRAQYRRTSGVVIFMANDQIQNEFTDAGYADYYSSFVPSAKYGYEFTGWDKTLDEINSSRVSGNVTVKANFALKKETFTVTINNGEVNADETVSCEESTLITRTAKAVEGKTFAYWMKDDALFTYNPKISFTANADCVITAVYTSNTVTEQTTAEINKVSYVDGDLIIKAGMSVPDGMTIVSVGIGTSSNSDMSEATETTATTSNNPAEFAVTKSGVAVNTTLYAQAYVTYTNGTDTITAESSVMAITAGQDYDAAEKGTATIRSAIYNADTKKATFNAYLTVPENAVIVKAGLVAAPSTSFNPESAVLTADYAAENSGFVKSLSTAEGKCVPVNYTWYKSNVNTGDTWYARAYLVYTLNGEQHTVYGSLVELKA